MESVQIIKNRIQSIKSTRQITQSMRMVSTSKVQRSRKRMNKNRPFFEQACLLADSVLSIMNGENHPYVGGNDVKTAAVVVVGGDRGLCGGYNVNVGREAAEIISSLGDVKILTIGGKARDFCRRRIGKSAAKSYIGISENPFFEDANEIAALLMQWFKQKEIGSIYIVRTEFQSMLAQSTKAEQIFPLVRRGEASTDIVGFEPSGSELIEQLAPFYLASAVYGAMLEASVCEQSARVTSMDSAVKSADEMIASLTLSYNQARQSRITQEIIEIVGGANAVG